MPVVKLLSRKLQRINLQEILYLNMGAGVILTNTTVPLYIYYLKKEYINQLKGSVVKRISHLTTDQEFRVRILAEPPV